MYFEQIRHPETGCLSHLVGCLSTRELAVVDPQPGPAPYVSVAAFRGCRITHVLDTHVHADHVSGARALAATVGAVLCMHEKADVAFEVRRLADGEVLKLGNARMEVLHTPGHSPESLCLLVADLARSPEPAFLLTGDALLIGDVGRPDLHVDPVEGSMDLYRSLRERLLPLPGELELFPAHFSGSSCGVGLSPRSSSTLGYERRVNPLLGDMTMDDFVSALTARTIPPPSGHERIVAANRGLA